jgi:hypothetical protein
VFPWYLDAANEVPYEEVLRLADAALYEAKSAGRNQSIGMVPTRQRSKPITAETINSRKESLAERLAATTVRTRGPIPGVARESTDTQAKAAAASQVED